MYSVPIFSLNPFLPSPYYSQPLTVLLSDPDNLGRLFYRFHCPCMFSKGKGKLHKLWSCSESHQRHTHWYRAHYLDTFLWPAKVNKKINKYKAWLYAILLWPPARQVMPTYRNILMYIPNLFYNQTLNIKLKQLTTEKDKECCFNSLAKMENNLLHHHMAVLM